VNNLRINLLHDKAKAPRREHSTDAGADIFYCPQDPIGPVIIPPRQTAVLETGIKVEVPAGYMLEVKNKSGIASKKSLVVGACVIDAGYDGQVFVNLHNIGVSEQVINPGDKLAQLVLIPIETCEFVVTSSKLNDLSSRGSGGFGSTGNV
jgi:dUTP pyrophosphatase